MNTIYTQLVANMTSNQITLTKCGYFCNCIHIFNSTNVLAYIFIIRLLFTKTSGDLPDIYPEAPEGYFGYHQIRDAVLFDVRPINVTTSCFVECLAISFNPAVLDSAGDSPYTRVHRSTCGA